MRFIRDGFPKEVLESWNVIRHNSWKAVRGKHSVLKELVYAEAYKQECTSNI